MLMELKLAGRKKRARDERGAIRRRRAGALPCRKIGLAATVDRAYRGAVPVEEAQVATFHVYRDTLLAGGTLTCGPRHGIRGQTAGLGEKLSQCFHNRTSKSMTGAGLEPATCGLKVRCSTS